MASRGDARIHGGLQPRRSSGPPANLLPPTVLMSCSRLPLNHAHLSTCPHPQRPTGCPPNPQAYVHLLPTSHAYLPQPRLRGGGVPPVGTSPSPAPDTSSSLFSISALLHREPLPLSSSSLGLGLSPALVRSTPGLPTPGLPCPPLLLTQAPQTIKEQALLTLLHPPPRACFMPTPLRLLPPAHLLVVKSPDCFQHWAQRFLPGNSLQAGHWRCTGGSRD